MLVFADNLPSDHCLYLGHWVFCEQQENGCASAKAPQQQEVSPPKPTASIGLGLDRTPENKNAMGAYLAFNPTYDQMNDQLGEMSRQLGRGSTCSI